jgi:hypothetical protein
MLLIDWRAINDIVPFIEFIKQLRNNLGRMLEIVV